MSPNQHFCLVCGYPNLEEEPRSFLGGASHEICPSCGYEYGYTDDDLSISQDAWREEWVKDGKPWRSSAVLKPSLGWNPDTQLAKVPYKNRSKHSWLQTSKSPPFFCPVCGWDRLRLPPYSSRGVGSNEVCYSCGFRFGVTDDHGHISQAEWRARWISRGCNWYASHSGPPLAGNLMSN